MKWLLPTEWQTVVPCSDSHEATPPSCHVYTNSTKHSMSLIVTQTYYSFWQLSKGGVSQSLLPGPQANLLLTHFNCAVNHDVYTTYYCSSCECAHYKHFYHTCYWHCMSHTGQWVLFLAAFLVLCWSLVGLRWRHSGDSKCPLCVVTQLNQTLLLIEMQGIEQVNKWEMCWYLCFYYLLLILVRRF